jgi:hypothetical protein
LLRTKIFIGSLETPAECTLEFGCSVTLLLGSSLLAEQEFLCRAQLTFLAYHPFAPLQKTLSIHSLSSVLHF